MTNIVTVSYQDGHYEVYDHTTNKKIVGVIYPDGNSRYMDAFDVCSGVEGILRNYEDTKREKEKTKTQN